jgi:hypothetical protein
MDRNSDEVAERILTWLANTNTNTNTSTRPEAAHS